MPDTPDAITTVLGFDYGARRIGVAVGNALTGSARALEVIANGTQGPDWTRVAGLVREWRPQMLLVGLPLDLATIRSDGLRIDSHQTIDNNDTYFQMIHTRWGESLMHAFEALPDPETLLSGGGSE